LAIFRQIQEVCWRRLRTDVTTNLEWSQISEESTAVPYGANLFYFYYFFPFRAPVRAGLSLPWFPVGTLYSITRFHCLHCCALLALYVYVPVCILVIFFVEQLNWIGLVVVE